MNTQPQWRFVGNVPENYERYLVPSIFAPWADDLVEAAALQPTACAGHWLRDWDRGTDRSSTAGKWRQCRRVGCECGDARCCPPGSSSRGCDYRMAGGGCFTAALGR